MNDDLINRQMVIDRIESIEPTSLSGDYQKGIAVGFAMAKMAIKEQLSVHPKVKTGHWIWRAREWNSYTKVTGLDSMGVEHTITYHEGGKYEEPHCSECNAVAAHNFYNYCPKCGVKMKEKE